MKKLLKFLKNWTLPVAMLTGVCVYLLFSWVPFLAPIGDGYAPYNEQVLPVFMFLMLYVTFCKVDFHKLLPVRWHSWISVQQTVFILALMGLIVGFNISGEPLIMLEAIIVCIIAPCAAAAPVVTAKLGGNLEEMTTYTFISNFITALLIPVCFPLIDKAANVSFLTAFLTILHEVCMVLVLPMLLAYIVKHGMKRLHRWLVSINDLSYYMWGGSLLIVSGTTAKNIAHADTSLTFLLIIALLGLVLCVVQFAVGRFIGHSFGATTESGQALGQKNTAFAIWIAYTTSTRCRR